MIATILTKKKQYLYSNNKHIENDGTNYSDFDSDIERNNVNENCEKSKLI